MILEHPRHKSCQLDQINRAKLAPPSSDFHERVSSRQTGPPRRNGDEPPLLVVEVRAILAPGLSVLEESEPLSQEWMEGMGDTKRFRF